MINYNYWPHPKDGEGNVFTSDYLLTGGTHSPAASPDPGSVMGERWVPSRQVRGNNMNKYLVIGWLAQQTAGW